MFFLSGARAALVLHSAIFLRVAVRGSISAVRRLLKCSNSPDSAADA
jgi:hypothetical protein